MEAIDKKFVIKNIDLLESALSANSTESIPVLVRNSVENFGVFFTKEKFAVTDKENTIYKALKEGFFTKTIFNSFLCCLFDGAYQNNEDSHNKHNLNDFINFYNAVDVPKSSLRKSDIKIYNAVLRKLTEKSPHLSGIHFNMNANWRITKENKIPPTPPPGNFSFLKKYFKIIIACLIFICSITVIKLFIGNTEPIIKDELTSYDDCKFPKDSTIKNKIIVLPFNNIIDDTQRFDFGYVIAMRLDSLSRVDSLELNIEYCTENINTSKFKRKHYEQIRKSKNANHLIYGFIEPGKVTKDNLTINNISDFRVRNNDDVNNIYGEFKRANRRDVNKGMLLKSFENNLYYNLTFICMELGKYKKALKYIKKLKPLDDFGQSLIYCTLAEIYRLLYLDDIAITYYSAAIQLKPNIPIYYALLGEILLDNEEYNYGEYFYTKALGKDRLVIGWVYRLYYASLQNNNIKVGAENITKIINGLLPSGQIDFKNKPYMKQLLFLNLLAIKDANIYSNQIEKLKKYKIDFEENLITELKVKIHIRNQKEASSRRENRLKLFVKNYSAKNYESANSYIRQLITFDSEYIKLKPYIKKLDYWDSKFNNKIGSSISYFKQKKDSLLKFYDSNNNDFSIHVVD
ncbi:MAG: tetratricopeptide repeat protein [Polaribacter sp.]